MQPETQTPFDPETPPLSASLLVPLLVACVLAASFAILAGAAFYVVRAVVRAAPSVPEAAWPEEALALDSIVPCAGSRVDTEPLEVRGRANRELTGAWIDGTPAQVHGREFRLAIPVHEGEMRSTIILQAGEESFEWRITWVGNLRPPEFLELDPPDGSSTGDPRPVLRGRVDDPSVWVGFAINGGPMTQDDWVSVNPRNGCFERAIPLEIGENLVEMVARDGSRRETKRSIRLHCRGPALAIEPSPGSRVHSTELELRVRADRGIRRAWLGDVPAEVDGRSIAATHPLAEGPAIYRLRFEDDAGAEYAIRLVYVGRPDPPRFLDLTASRAQGVTVRGRLDDPHGEVRLGRGGWRPVEPSGRFAIETNAPDDATRLEVEARDVAGRTATATARIAPDRPPFALRSGWTYTGRNEHGAHEVWRGADGATMVFVPAGAFRMGSPEGEGREDERPQRRVHLEAFFIDKREVTWAQYLAFCEATDRARPSRPLGSGDDHPVVNVLWEDARAFSIWAGGDLPREAQWEKAARGLDGRLYPWGDEEPDSTRMVPEDPGFQVRERPTRPVGRFPAGASFYGCLDMSGNVAEWCLDWYDPTYYRYAPDRDPPGPDHPGERRFRVSRSRNWYQGATEGPTCSSRYMMEETRADDGLGFRVAAAAP